MEAQTEEKKLKKGFFARMLGKLDKLMQEKAKSSSCCGKDNNSEDKKSCCS